MSARATANPPQVGGDEQVTLRRVSWETYERLLADDAERRVPRLTFDHGVLELVTPSMPHDEDTRTISLFIEIVTAVLGIPIRGTGSTTFRRRDLERGFEPDASFHIQHEPQIRGQREVDLLVDPPPDLVLEMEYSRSAIDKLELFASMGVPEVWRCDGEDVTIHLLAGGRYHESSNSACLPIVTSEAVSRLLAVSRTMLSPAWFRAVSEWAGSQETAPPAAQQ